MNTVKRIRTQLGMTQAELARALGISQGNVGHYEARDQLVSVPVAVKLIRLARRRGVTVTFDDIYGHFLRRSRRATPRRAAQAGH